MYFPLGQVPLHSGTDKSSKARGVKEGSCENESDDNDDGDDADSVDADASNSGPEACTTRTPSASLGTSHTPTRPPVEGIRSGTTENQRSIAVEDLDDASGR